MSSKPWILVVDDELSVRDSLQAWFKEEGYGVEAAASGKEALERMARQEFDIYLLDIRMAGMDGIELQHRIREIKPDAAVIIMTAYASVETAVQALKEGAFDYITKPFDPDDLEHLVRNAAERQSLQRENAALRRNLAEVTHFPEIVGESPAIKRILELVKTVASTDATVLVTGESGTGKELVARAVHAASNRRFMPLVTVNCGSLNEGVLESELFGHERGAFTGAQYRHKGKFEMADGGTLFLDEVADISTKTQADLLRVLEEKQICRVGGTRMVPVDFRLVAATNRDLREMVVEKTFREDLFYRLNVFQIPVPALRDRLEDIPALVQHFVRKSARQIGKTVVGANPQALTLLKRHGWPGNIRELLNAVERAVVVSQDEWLGPEDFALEVQPAKDRGATDPTLSLSDVERQHIEQVLLENHWNISQSARVLGVDRATLYNKIKRYGFAPPRP
jgi:two-component system, NtrC family, response regulator HydG